MYEARQNKEKVSRRIDGSGGLNQRKKEGDRKNTSRTIEVGNNRESYPNCMQFMLTRAGINNAVDKILRNEESLDNYDLYDQYLIIDRAIERRIDIREIVTSDTPLFATFLMYYVAEEDSDVDHPNTADAVEIPFVSSEQALQLKRGPGLSGPRTILPFFRDGYYMRDKDGNIDFDKINKYNGKFQSPVEPNSYVDLEEGSDQKEFGVLLNGNKVHIPDASRSQHFSIANRVAKRRGQTSGDGGNSPGGLTWHHLINKYKMVLVNRDVHQKFGHNGGYYFW